MRRGRESGRCLEDLEDVSRMSRGPDEKLQSTQSMPPTMTLHATPFCKRFDGAVVGEGLLDFVEMCWRRPQQSAFADHEFSGGFGLLDSPTVSVIFLRRVVKPRKSVCDLVPSTLPHHTTPTPVGHEKRT